MVRGEERRRSQDFLHGHRCEGQELPIYKSWFVLDIWKDGGIGLFLTVLPGRPPTLLL